MSDVVFPMSYVVLRVFWKGRPVWGLCVCRGNKKGSAMVRHCLLWYMVFISRKSASACCRLPDCRRCSGLGKCFLRPAACCGLGWKPGCFAHCCVSLMRNCVSCQRTTFRRCRRPLLCACQNGLAWSCCCARGNCCCRNCCGCCCPKSLCCRCWNCPCGCKQTCCCPRACCCRETWCCR